MAASVSFNGFRVTRKLDYLVTTQLPWVATKTLSGLARQVKKDLQHEMVDSFTYLSPFTYNSIGIKNSTKKNLVAEVFHKDRFSKGNQPAEYLMPLIKGGNVFLTRFQRRLEAKGVLSAHFGRYMLPVHKAPGVSLTGSGRLAKTEYVKALRGASLMEDLRTSGKYGKRGYKTKGTYMWVPPRVQELNPKQAGRIRGANKGQIPHAGIYRVDAGGLTQIFKQLKRVPRVEKDHYLFYFTGEQSVRKNYQRIFNQEVKALGLQNF